MRYCCLRFFKNGSAVLFLDPLLLLILPACLPSFPFRNEVLKGWGCGWVIPPPQKKKSSTPPFSLSITLFVEGSTICGTCPRPRTLSLSLPMDNTNLCRASLFGVLFGYSQSARKRDQKAGVPTSWIYQMVPWFLFYKLICEGNGLRLLMQRAFSYQVQYDFYTKYIANKNKIFKKNTYLSAGSLDYQDD